MVEWFRDWAVWATDSRFVQKLLKNFCSMKETCPSSWWADSKQLFTLCSGGAQWCLIFRLKMGQKEFILKPLWTFLVYYEFYKIQLQFTVCSCFSAQSVCVCFCEYVRKCNSRRAFVGAKMKKSDRGSGWVNELPVCQSEGVPSRDWWRFAPLASC